MALRRLAEFRRGRRGFGGGLAMGCRLFRRGPGYGRRNGRLGFGRDRRRLRDGRGRGNELALRAGPVLLVAAVRPPLPFPKGVGAAGDLAGLVGASCCIHGWGLHCGKCRVHAEVVAKVAPKVQAAPPVKGAALPAAAMMASAAGTVASGSAGARGLGTAWLGGCCQRVASEWPSDRRRSSSHRKARLAGRMSRIRRARHRAGGAGPAFGMSMRRVGRTACNRPGPNPMEWGQLRPGANGPPAAAKPARRFGRQRCACAMVTRTGMARQGSPGSVDDLREGQHGFLPQPAWARSSVGRSILTMPKSAVITRFDAAGSPDMSFSKAEGTICQGRP